MKVTTKRQQFVLTTLLILLAQGIQSEDPKPQKWENKWKATFVENIHFPLLGTKISPGTYYYDFNTRQQRIERKYGSRDFFCSLIFLFSNSRCDHIITGKYRYIHYPEKKYCCRCCSVAQGCGITKPDWMVKGKFLGTKSDAKGTYNSYGVRGNMDNLYEVYNSPLREPKTVSQLPRSEIMFDKESYDTKFDGQVFKLPEDSGDCEKECPFLTFCTVGHYLHYLGAIF